jgi:hypothetical protein
MTSGIYCIENLTDNKKYIGWATNMKRRFKTHCRELNNNRHKNNYFQNAWNKYGEENFKFWIIEEYPREKEILKLMEIYFISCYDSFWEDGRGYNLTRGGEGNLGRTFSQETRSRMRIARLGEKNPNYGKSMSEEQKKLISNANLGKTRSEAARKLMSIARSGEKNPLWGKHPSEKTLELMRKVSSGKHPSEATRKKLSESGLGKKHAIQTKKKEGTSSKYFGVSINTNSGRWNCGVGRKYIARFDRELEAALAYDKYVIENNLGRPLNFPENP